MNSRGVDRWLAMENLGQVVLTKDQGAQRCTTDIVLVPTTITNHVLLRHARSMLFKNKALATVSTAAAAIDLDFSTQTLHFATM